MDANMVFCWKVIWQRWHWPGLRHLLSSLKDSLHPPETMLPPMVVHHPIILKPWTLSNGQCMFCLLSLTFFSIFICYICNICQVIQINTKAINWGGCYYGISNQVILTLHLQLSSRSRVTISLPKQGKVLFVSSTSRINIRVLHPLQLYPSHFISSRSHLLSGLVSNDVMTLPLSRRSSQGKLLPSQRRLIQSKTRSSFEGIDHLPK